MKLGIISGSIREGRVTHHIAEAVADRAAQMEGVESKLIDLKELDLPFFDEAISPKYNQNRQPEGAVKQWLDALADTDAIVIVSPEYNRSVPGALKNAFDFIAHEVSHKPMALVSHGSYSGAFTLNQLRTVVPELGGITIPQFIGLPYGAFDAEGNYAGERDELNGRIDGLLEELQKYSDALQAVRN